MINQLEYICFLSGQGYSQAAQDLIWAIQGTGRYDIKLSCLNGTPLQEPFSEPRFRTIKDMCRKGTFETAVQVYHCVPHLQWRVRKLKKSIGFATFETFDPPAEWIPILNQNSAVVVPSLFNKRIFENAGVNRPIFHIPHCFDTSLYSLNTPPLAQRPRFTFLFFGTWKIRKGWDQLIEAWFREFKDSDGVQLLIKTDRTVEAREDISQIRKKLGFQEKEVAPILFESKVFDELTLPRFLKSVDCLVFPTMGEGFGLPPLQCMAVGTPVICTGFSGCEDFVSDTTATVLKPDGFLIHRNLDNIEQFRNRKWAHVSVSSIMSAMRYVLENDDEVKKKANFAAGYVAENFCYRHAAESFNALMDVLD